MKKLIVIMVFLAFFTTSFGLAVANDFGLGGPAPNSGDGVSDGSGFDAPPNGPNADGTSGAGNVPMGPAPNSGDGVPDGSGF
jgi:hypothetical protein